jgi:outer membrane protein
MESLRRSLDVTTTKLLLPGLILALAAGAWAQAAPTKVGIIHIQNAILSTKDGQKAAAELQQKMGPKQKELEKKQGEIQSMQTKLRTSSNTASEEIKQQLMRDIDTRTKAYNRDLEDAQAEFEQEQQKVLQELGAKIMAVIDKYATDNGYAVILDVSAQQTPVLYAANSVDITREIVALYDKSAPAGAAPAAATPASVRPVAPKPVAPAKK